jgi:hypothetical protein
MGDCQTPASLAVELHYRKLDLQDKWNERRITRLCGFIRINRVELAALIGVPFQTFERQISRRKVNFSACILLSILEHTIIGDYVDDTIPNVITESYGKLKHTQEVRLHA